MSRKSQQVIDRDKFKENELLLRVQPLQNKGTVYTEQTLEKYDYLCKINLKETYLSVPLHKQSQNFLRFQWQEKLYQFLCLSFGLFSAPRMFTKLLKFPLSILRRLNIILILYLDDILLIIWSRKEVIMAMETLIFLLQNLDSLNLSSNLSENRVFGSSYQLERKGSPTSPR